MHSSRVEESLDWFLSRQRERPDDLCALYFPALIYLNFDVGGMTAEQQQEVGGTLLQQAIDAGEGRPDDRDADVGERYCLGALYGLRASDRLRRSKYLGAAFDAKRARNVMLEVLDDEPDWVDCRFWVGSYDYFADVLPGLIKFFRSVLFFPDGDRDRGIATLRDVAERGALDRYNALWVLFTLYRGLERDPRQAAEVLERIRAVYPDDIDSVLMLAWHHARYARPPDRPRGIALHLEALRMAGRLGGEAGVRLARTVKISLSRAYLDDLRPEAAVELLRPLFAAATGDEEHETLVALALVRALNRAGLHEEAIRVLEEVSARHPGSPGLEAVANEAKLFDALASRVYRETVAAWRVGREGDPTAAERLFRDLLAREREAAAGLVHYGMAGMYNDLERYDDAESHYRLAVAAGIGGPPHFLPIALLRIGHARDLRGDRGAAKAFYRKALSTAGDSDWIRREAKYYLKQPFTDPDDALIR